MDVPGALFKSAKGVFQKGNSVCEQILHWTLVLKDVSYRKGHSLFPDF